MKKIFLFLILLGFVVLAHAANAGEYICSKCRGRFTLKVRDESVFMASSCAKISVKNKDVAIHCTTPLTEYIYFNGQKHDYDVLGGEYAKNHVFEGIAYDLYLKSDEYKNLQKQQKEQEAKEQKGTRTTLITILLVAGYFIFASIYSINLARQNKIIFFNTQADLYTCFGILAVPLVLVFIIGPYAFIVGIPISLLYNIVKPITLNFKRTAWYNLFLLISARLAMGLIIPVILLGQFLEIFERRKDEDAAGHAIRAAVTMAIVSGVVKLMHYLVNGQQVRGTE